MPGFAAVRVCLCYDRVCPGIRLGGWLNAGVLGSVQCWLPGWQGLEWEQKNMSGRALALQIGSEMAPRPFTGRVNWTLIKHSEGRPCQRVRRINPVHKRAARKSIANWNINTCNHGSESTLLRQPVQINCRFPATLKIIHKSWKLATGVSGNYWASCGGLPDCLAMNSHSLVSGRQPVP